MSQNLKKTKSSFLISGTSSGLGKYLHEHLGGISLNREKINTTGADIIIHCAFNSEQHPKDVEQYFHNNVLLIEKLTKIPHKKFVFVSSVDVYPKNSKKHKEDEKLDANKADSLYAKAKLLSEDVVKKNCPNFLILRCSAILGKDARKNSLIKIITDDNPTLTLSEKSIFNYILHSDVLALIKLSIRNDLVGVYNLASSKNITLRQVAELVKKKVTFGDYIYSVGNIDNRKAATVSRVFKKTSQKIISEFIQQSS